MGFLKKELNFKMQTGSYHITLAGIICDEAFHRCLACVKELQAKHPTRVQSNVLQFFST